MLLTWLMRSRMICSVWGGSTSRRRDIWLELSKTWLRSPMRSRACQRVNSCRLYLIWVSQLILATSTTISKQFTRLREVREPRNWRISWDRYTTASLSTSTTSLPVSTNYIHINTRVIYLLVTTADSMSANSGKCMILLKMELLNQSNEKESVFTELTLD